VLTDYHVHLRPDDRGSDFARYFNDENVERYLEAASERGISSLGVSEHVYRFRQALEVWDHPFWVEEAVDDLDEYCEFVRGSPLLLGIEADFVLGAEDRMANLLEEHEWDYVLGSIHFVPGGAVDHADWDVYESADPERVWRMYFEMLGDAARSGMFDVLAHPDLVKMWGAERPRPERDPRHYYELAMEGIADSDVAIEVSTAGLRKPVGEIYPSRPFLELCLDVGRPLSLSSDAHVPEDLGHRYDEAIELLRSLGVEEIAVFDRRERRMEPLG
jgi:histidinol-phosphatase (PHP family)